MNDHNLDDLIIDTNQPKNSKSKSLLTIVALLIVVFIVGIILARLNLEESGSNNAIIEENESEMISPELTLQSVTEPKEKNTGPKLTEIIEEELNKPIQAPEIAQKSVTQEQGVPKGNTAPEPVKEETVVVEDEVVEITKEPAEAPVEPEISSVPSTVTTAQENVVVPKPAPQVKKETVIQKPKEPTPKPVATGSYFIQVGSYRQTPSKRFLSVIQNNGFAHTITAPNAKGIKKLLIGPYPDRAAANAALVRVRDLINKSAFVVKK